MLSIVRTTQLRIYEPYTILEGGHVLDAGNSNRLQRVSWIEGPPEKGLMGYRIKGRRRIPTVTWRCPRCGWLVWFAQDEPG